MPIVEAKYVFVPQNRPKLIIKYSIFVSNIVKFVEYYSISDQINSIEIDSLYVFDLNRDNSYSEKIEHFRTREFSNTVAKILPGSTFPSIALLLLTF